MGGRSVRKLVRGGPTDILGVGNDKVGNDGEEILGENGGGNSVVKRPNGGATAERSNERNGSSSKRFRFGGFGRNRMDGRGRTDGSRVNSDRTACTTEDLSDFLDARSGSDERTESGATGDRNMAGE